MTLTQVCEQGTAVAAQSGETMISRLTVFIDCAIGAFIVAVLYLGLWISFFLGKALFKVIMFLLLKSSYILYVLLT